MVTDTRNEISVSQNAAGKISEPSTKLAKGPMFAPLEEVERLFERLMPSTWMRPAAVWNWPLWGNLEESFESIRQPQLNVLDCDKEVLIRAEMPGVEKKDIEVSINNSTLNIRGQVNREMEEQKMNYVRCEIAHGFFSRSIAIPEGVDTAKVSASLKDGILEVILPKEAGTQRRAVEVK